MKNPSVKDICDTPAVEIPIQKVAPGRLAGKVENIEFQTLFCRQAVARHLDALEDSLNKKNAHAEDIEYLFGSYIDASKTLLNANHGIAHELLLELFCDRFAETLVLIGGKMQEKGVSKEYSTIMLSKIGILAGSRENIKMAIMRDMPTNKRAEDEWEEYESRPTHPYNENLTLRLQRYMEEEEKLRQVNEPSASKESTPARFLTPQDSLSPTDCNPARAEQGKYGRNKIAAISAIVGLGALTTVGLTTFGKKDNNQVFADVMVPAEPQPETLNFEDIPDKTIVPENDSKTERKEKIICSADTSAPDFANYMTVIRKGNPPLAELIEKAFATAAMETKDENVRAKTILLEKALNRMGEINRNADNTGYQENIATFIKIHSTALENYKKNGVWQSGNEQTRLLYDKLYLDCKKDEK